MTDSTNDELRSMEYYHPSYCDKYEALRGIYPNNRRDTGKPCSCGFEASLHQHAKQAKKQGFYMGCGVGGIHESNVEDLWNKCVAQLATNPKDNITLCSNCHCMTHTVDNKCGKCGESKEGA